MVERIDDDNNDVWESDSGSLSVDLDGFENMGDNH